MGELSGNRESHRAIGGSRSLPVPSISLPTFTPTAHHQISRAR